MNSKPTTLRLSCLLAAVAALAVAGLPAQTSSCIPAPAGLVSWWRAELSMIDAWGDNDGIPGYSTYGVPYTSGRVGSAFSFNGNASYYVRVPDAPSLRLTNALSIEAWVLPTSSAARTIVCKGEGSFSLESNSGTNDSFFLGTYFNGAPWLVVSPWNSGRTNVMLIGPQPLPSGVFSHLAATYDGSALRLYVNGSLVAQKNYSGGVFPGTADAGIGAIPGDEEPLRPYYSTGTWPWSGALDEVSLYNRALSGDEILALYNSGFYGKCKVFPTILVQPQNQTIPLGEDVRFSLTLQGTKPFTFQWFKDSQLVLWATNASLLLEHVQTNQAGLYSVRVGYVDGHGGTGYLSSSNASLTLTPPPACAPLPNNLVSWWAGEDSIFDAVNTNDASIYDPPSTMFLTGKVGHAFNLTNFYPYSSESVGVYNSSSLNFGSNADFSIEAWIKAFARTPRPSPPFYFQTPIQTIVAKQYGNPWPTTVAGYALLLDQGRLACYLATNSFYPPATFVSEGPDLRDGMFHHVALTVKRDANNGGVLYVDGQTVLTFDPTPFIRSLSNPFNLLIGSGPTPFSGLIDELCLYNRALGPDEVLAIRQAGAAGKCRVSPYIVTQPTNQFVNAGTSVTLSVLAAGTGLLRYQWLRNNYPVANTTTGSWTFDVYESGAYSVRVSNAFGSVLSSNAVLTVNQPPHAQCTSITVAAGPDCLASASIDYHTYDPNHDPLTLTQMPPGPYPLGTNLVTLTATDPYGLSNSCSALVVVVDRTPPVLICPPVVQSNDPNQCGAIVNYPLPTATDCSPVTNLICVPPPGSFFLTGATTVQCLASDAAGNTATNSFTVTVQDTQPPTITCPADIVVTNAHDAWSSMVNFNPIATDNCPGVGQPVCDPASGSTFGLGVRRVTCSVADAAGNSNQSSFTVTVLPGNQPPVPLIQIAPVARFPGETNLLVIAALCASNATVYFDGSRSYDPDDSTFDFAWYEGSNCLATSVVATNQLALGLHDILLQLDDTFPLGTNSAMVTVSVLSPAQAIGIVSDLLNTPTLAPERQHPLQSLLSAATAGFGRCDLTESLNQLQAFQNEVRAQVAPLDSSLAHFLLQATDQLLGSLSLETTAGGTTFKLHSPVRQPDGKVRLKFTGQAPRVPLVQASTNLRDWTTLGIANDDGNGALWFEDSQAARLPTRFYRLTGP